MNRKELKLLQTIGKGEFGGEELISQGSLHHLISYIRAMITETKFALDIALKLHPVCVLRCDGRRLQRDQGGGQVYQK